MKKALRLTTSLLLVVCLLAVCLSGPAEAYAREPEIKAEGAILIEYETGKVLYTKNADKSMYPASTTKIMTALLALEKLDLQSRITVPEDMGPAAGSAMYLLPGERFTVRELLDALMVKSANDAAVLLARSISGSVENFARLMNERAREIGAQNTNFVNPSGLPDDEHTTTAYDMALISREAMKNPMFREIASQVLVTLDETPLTPEKRYFRNSNRFLWSQQKINYRGEYIPIKYEAVDGIKTGYTRQASHCLVSTGYKNGIRVIAVVFNAQGPEVYLDSRKLLDYGFENFETVTLLGAHGVLGMHEFPGENQDKLMYGLREEYTAVRHLNDPEFFQYTKEIRLDQITPPVDKDEIIGKLIIQSSSSNTALDIYAFKSIDQQTGLTGYLGNTLSQDRSIPLYILIFLGTAVSLTAIWFLKFRRPYKRKYKIRRIKRLQ